MVQPDAAIGGKNKMIEILVVIQMIVIGMSVIAQDRLRKEVNNLAKAHLELINVFQQLLQRTAKPK